MPKVITTDDAFVAYQNRSLTSAPILVPKGAEIRLGPSVVHEGREWMDTTLPDGTTGFVLGPTARGHTTLGSALDSDTVIAHGSRDFRPVKLCPSCRNEIPGQSRYCLSCGNAIESLAHGTAIPGRPLTHPSRVAVAGGERKEEKKFFEDRGVIVTSARFITGEQTFAVGGITSVKSFRQDPSRTGPIVWAIVGLLAMLATVPTNGLGNGAVLVGLIIFAAAVLYSIGQKTEFSVLLTTASGEVKALASRDGAFISKVVSALNDSIVHRG